MRTTDRKSQNSEGQTKTLIAFVFLWKIVDCQRITTASKYHAFKLTDHALVHLYLSKCQLKVLNVYYVFCHKRRGIVKQLQNSMISTLCKEHNHSYMKIQSQETPLTVTSHP